MSKEVMCSIAWFFSTLSERAALWLTLGLGFFLQEIMSQAKKAKVEESVKFHLTFWIDK